MKWLSKKKKLEKVIHHVDRLINHRETHIALTVFISLISVWLLNLDQPDYYATFQMHYLVDFIRSTYIFCLCFLVHVYTNSKRILWLTGFVAACVLFDLAFLLDKDNFDSLDAIRHTNTINFSDLFRSYEILCLLFSFKYWIKNAITKSKGSINNRGNLCDFRVHKANTARNKKA